MVGNFPTSTIIKDQICGQDIVDQEYGIGNYTFFLATPTKDELQIIFLWVSASLWPRIIPLPLEWTAASSSRRENNTKWPIFKKSYKTGPLSISFRSSCCRWFVYNWILRRRFKLLLLVGTWCPLPGNCLGIILLFQANQLCRKTMFGIDRVTDIIPRWRCGLWYIFCGSKMFYFYLGVPY